MISFIDYMTAMDEGTLPDSMRLTSKEEEEYRLEVDRMKKDHQRKARSAKKQGKSYPETEYGGSWAHGEEFRRRKRG